MKKLFFLFIILFAGMQISAQSNNVLIGAASGVNITTGDRNTFIGDYTGFRTTSGSYSLYAGYYAGNESNANGNVFLGSWSGMNNTTGERNVFIGYSSGNWNSSGHKNTFIGYSSGYENTTGRHNTFIGYESGNENRTGECNTFIGLRSGKENVYGIGNTFLGDSSGYWNQGNRNTYVGKAAGKHTTTGESNAFLGANSGFYNTTGRMNTFSGYTSGFNNITGAYNSFYGFESGLKNTSGNFNTFLGVASGKNNTSGNGNVFLGMFSGEENSSGRGNVFIGNSSGWRNSYGNNNTAVGNLSYQKEDNLSNSTCIGYNAIATASNQVRIGNTEVKSIGGQVSWSTFSDGRYKENVEEYTTGLKFIQRLHPVSYTVNMHSLSKALGLSDSLHVENSEQNARKIGFIAQEVEALIGENDHSFDVIDFPTNNNDFYGIRYAEFVIPLVNAVKELSASKEELQISIADLENQIILQQAQINQLQNQLGINFVSNSLINNDCYLLQCQPNPTSGAFEIGVILADNINAAELILLNTNGLTVKNIPIYNRGKLNIAIPAGDLESGNYVYILVVDGITVGSRLLSVID